MQHQHLRFHHRPRDERRPRPWGLRRQVGVARRLRQPDGAPRIPRDDRPRGPTSPGRRPRRDQARPWISRAAADHPRGALVGRHRHHRGRHPPDVAGPPLHLRPRAGRRGERVAAVRGLRGHSRLRHRRRRRQIGFPSSRGFKKGFAHGARPTRMPRSCAGAQVPINMSAFGTPVKAAAWRDKRRAGLSPATRGPRLRSGRAAGTAGSPHRRHHHECARPATPCSSPSRTMWREVVTAAENSGRRRA